MKTLLLCCALLSLKSLALAQTLEGAELPDSAVLARFGGNTSKPGDLPDIDQAHPPPEAK